MSYNTGVVSYNNTGVVSNTEVCHLGSKMPVMGDENTESDFDKKWRAYLGEDGWRVMKGLAQEAVKLGAKEFSAGEADSEAAVEIYANSSDPSNSVFITGSNASFPTGSDTNSTKDNWNTVKYYSGPSSLFEEPETKQIQAPMPPTEQLYQVAVPSSSAEQQCRAAVPRT